MQSLHPRKLGLPPLLLAYLKMGAKVFGANVDEAFGSSLDFGMLCKLRDMPPAYLKKFMGRRGYQEKIDFWKTNGTQ